ncbi:LacI family DNA-binding transcriptional regulator [Allohahella marinimesophila]|uniref:Catabolite repressor/activator n=1 Tax=Allohahella marinimesophila TaxID=1054972 RepID=A0ABP7NTS9_9GAMM
MKLEDIARLAGVSKATVSSVLNGKAEKYRISVDTQLKVREVALKHGYQANHSAAALRRGSSRSIGFIIPDFENRSYLRIAKCLERLARAQGYQLIIASSDDDADTELAAARMMVSRGIDALLVSSCTIDPEDTYAVIQRKGTPVIALDRPLNDSFYSVTSDDRQGALELVRSMELDSHPIRAKALVLIGAMPEMKISQLREQGFRAAVADIPQLTEHCFYGTHFDMASGKAALESARSELGRTPDAIVTTSFSLLEGVMEGLRSEMQAAWSKSVSPVRLATFGNSRLLDFLPFPVNSLTQQHEAIAEAAWQLAQRAIDDDSTPENVMIDRVLQNRWRTWATAAL